MTNRRDAIIRNRRLGGVFPLLLAFLLSACAGAATPGAVELNPPAPTTAQTLTLTATPIPHTRTPTASESPTPTASPTPTFTATATRVPPQLPPLFTSGVLKKGDLPHTYLDDTCAYLKARWDADGSAPGTVVMPIMFHSITQGELNFYDQMTVDAFDDLMAALVEAGFQAIDSEQMLAFLDHNAYIPPRSVLLIVDDRKREEYFVRHFGPFHAEHGWPVVNAWISAVDTPAYLWKENQRLAQAGWVDHQAHGVVHNRTATGEVDDEFLQGELYGSIEAIERYFGKRPRVYVWPGGNFTPRSVELAREAGYEAGFTVNPRGPVMFNWVPLGDEFDTRRPTFMPEGPIGDPLMVLPRYWSTDAIWQIPRVIQIGEEAAAEALRNRSLELEYYDIVCTERTGPLSIEYP